ELAQPLVLRGPDAEVGHQLSVSVAQHLVTSGRTDAEHADELAAGTHGQGLRGIPRLDSRVEVERPEPAQLRRVDRHQRQWRRDLLVGAERRYADVLGASRGAGV